MRVGSLRYEACPARRGVLTAYVALLVFMAGSVCVGLALAWDLPWI